MASWLGRPVGEVLHVSVLGNTNGGKYLFTQDEVGVIKWDLDTGKIVYESPEQHAGLAFSGDGRRAVAAQGSRLRLCDNNLRPLHPSADFPRAGHLFYQKDGKLIEQAQWSGPLRIWDLSAGKIVQHLVRHKAPHLNRSPCSYDALHTLFAHHTEHGLAVHDLVADHQLWCLDFGETVTPILSKDGERLMIVTWEKDSALVRWFKSRTGRELGRHRLPKRRPNWFAHDGSVFGHLAPDGCLVLVDYKSKETLFNVGFPRAPELKDVEPKLPEWSYEDAGFDQFIFAVREGREFAVWNSKNGDLLRRFHVQPKEHFYGLWRGVLSPDARLLGVIGYPLCHNELLIYETATGRLRGRIRAPNPIHCFDFAPDGKTLATSCEDTSVLIWDINRPLNGNPNVAPPRNAAETEQLWRSLANPDPAMAESAMWALIRTPEQVLPLLARSCNRLFARAGEAG